MSNLFKNITKESLLKDPIALDYDYQPKLVPYRENQQKYIATCINPLLQNRNGKNLLIFGPPGVGKTVSVKHIKEELELQTDEITPIYINCWKKDTPNKIALEIAKKLKYKYIQNKTTDKIFEELIKILNKTSTLIILDEIDKLQDQQPLYLLLEELYKKTIILITNESKFLITLDRRINSRLTPETLEFKPYTKEETLGILKQRAEYAFPKEVLSKQSLNLIAEKTFQLKDIRKGLYLLKESALLAEDQSQKQITEKHTEKAIQKLMSKKEIALTQEQKDILNLIKQNSGKTLKELHLLYTKDNQIPYRTFHRRIETLDSLNLINTEKKIDKGQTTIIHFS